MGPCMAIAEMKLQKIGCFVIELISLKDRNNKKCQKCGQQHSHDKRNAESAKYAKILRQTVTVVKHTFMRCDKEAEPTKITLALLAIRRVFRFLKVESDFNNFL